MERLTAADFEGELLRRDGDWAICFAADWCSFCRHFLKLFEALDVSRAFHVAAGDVTNMDTPLWEDFSIEVVPTIVAFRNGAAVQRWDGVYGVGLTANDLASLRAFFGESEIGD